MDYKKEFQAARKNNDWSKVQELWKSLCVEAEIEEVGDGDKGESETIANLRNMRSSNQMPGGKKI